MHDSSIYLPYNVITLHFHFYLYNHVSDLRHICQNLNQFGHGRGTIYGGCAQFTIIPASYAYPLKTNLEPRKACLLEREYNRRLSYARVQWFHTRVLQGKIGVNFPWMGEVWGIILQRLDMNCGLTSMPCLTFFSIWSCTPSNGSIKTIQGNNSCYRLVMRTVLLSR